MNDKFEELHRLLLQIDDYCNSNKIEYVFAAIDNDPKIKISVDFATKSIWYNVVKNGALNKALDVARQMLKEPLVKIPRK